MTTPPPGRHRCVKFNLGEKQQTRILQESLRIRWESPRWWGQDYQRWRFSSSVRKGSGFSSGSVRYPWESGKNPEGNVAGSTVIISLLRMFSSLVRIRSGFSPESNKYPWKSSRILQESRENMTGSTIAQTGLQLGMQDPSQTPKCERNCIKNRPRIAPRIAKNPSKRS